MLASLVARYLMRKSPENLVVSSHVYRASSATQHAKGGGQTHMFSFESGLARSDGVISLDLLAFLAVVLVLALSPSLPDRLRSFRSCASMASANNCVLGLGLRLAWLDLWLPFLSVPGLLDFDGDLCRNSSSEKSLSSDPEILLASKSDPSSSQKSSMTVSSCIESVSEQRSTSTLLTTGLGLVFRSSVRLGLMESSPSSSKIVPEGTLSILGRSKVLSDSAPSLRRLTVPFPAESSVCVAERPNLLLFSFIFLPKSCSSGKSSSSESTTMRLPLAMAANPSKLEHTSGNNYIKSEMLNAACSWKCKLCVHSHARWFSLDKIMEGALG